MPLQPLGAEMQRVRGPPGPRELEQKPGSSSTRCSRRFCAATSTQDLLNPPLYAITAHYSTGNVKKSAKNASSDLLCAAHPQSTSRHGLGGTLLETQPAPARAQTHDATSSLREQYRAGRLPGLKMGF